LKEAARKVHAAGFAYPKSGAKVPVSTVHTILRNRLYTGWFEWNGKLIQGKHEALVSAELWERVQGVLDGRFAGKAKRGRHDFAFSGLIACHACGCAVVGEIKKQLYVYYHCTGYADKCQGNPASCRRRYVREESLEAQFTELLGRLRFDDEVLEWVRDALHASHADERREHEEAIKRHQAEYNRLNDRIHAMYVDKLDRLVDMAFYDRCRTNGARSRIAASARSNGARTPTKILSGRRSRAPRPRPERPKAVRQAGTARKTPLAELRAIELHLGGW
jgi:site-specific DNA recombinase